ncbi:reticulon-3 isoform X4 [Sapajus apella]|uniref:Reticulon n=2 Tax=Platyrrhini TaxID=9479 RepID=A0A6J3IAB4_SAPAP|nr:reticulon-3 isoform X4 [Sapajus apella]
MHNLPTLKHSHKEVGCNTTPLLLDSAAVVGAAWGLVTPLESGPKGRSSPRRARGAACEAPRETGFAPPSRQKRGETVPAPAPCTTARFGTHSGAFVRVRARAPALLLCSAESVSQSVGDCPRSRQSEGTWTSQLPEYFISPPLLPPRVSLHPSPALARVAMAEPSAATQSPSISSSSSGAEPSAPGGGGSPGGCPALGTKSCSSSCAVHDLIFWRDVKKTGFVFGTTLIMLLSLAAFSVISVVSYLILALLSVTISFRVYKSVIQAVQKSEEGHPFKAYLDVDITLSSEAFHNYMNAAMVHINRALKLIIRLFLVEDLVDSLKLAVFMWLMTYVGAVFNGITLLILAELLIFSVPIVYEKYKTQIDHYVGIARDQTKSIVEKIQAKLPGIAKKKAE